MCALSAIAAAGLQGIGLSRTKVSQFDDETHTLTIQRDGRQVARGQLAAAAESRGHAGHWAVLNTRSSMEPFLTYSDQIGRAHV